MGKPFISVIITAYNRREYLKYAVKSVINQTLDKSLYEIIVVKNFRDPEVDRIVESNRGKIIDAGNEIIGKYITRGINEAEGEIIAFLDDDDAYHSRKLERVFKVFSENENLDYYHHNVIPINKNGQIINFDVLNIREQVLIKNLNDKLLALKKYDVWLGFHMSAISIRKELAMKIIRHILPYVFYGQDIIIYSLALSYGRFLLHEPYNLAFYRIHERNVSEVYSNDIKKMAKIRTLTLLSYSLLIKILDFDSNLKNAEKILIERMIGDSRDSLLTIMTGLKYYIIRQSFMILSSGIKNASANRVVTSLLGIIYLINPYIGRKLVYRRYLKYLK